MKIKTNKTNKTKTKNIKNKTIIKRQHKVINEEKKVINNINKDLIKIWNQKFSENKSNLLIQNIISLNSLTSISINRSHHQEDDQCFSNRVKPIVDITNQHMTGNCWIHAGLNVIRPQIVNKFNLNKSFEFSVSYLYLYDRLEAVNEFFNNLINQNNEYRKTKKDLIKNIKNKQNINSLMSKCIDDGGDFPRFRYLVNKYGLMPKSVFKESFHTTYSYELNKVLNNMCNSYAMNILDASRNSKFDLSVVMEEFYMTIVKFIGTPPETFNWEYYESEENDEKYHMYEKITPTEFTKMLKFKIDDFIPLVNNPNYKYMKTYTQKTFSNISNDKEQSLNLDMERILELIILMINSNIPVWFGCDINKNFNPNLSILDSDACEYETLLDIKHHVLDKNHRLKWMNETSLHAMVIVAYKYTPNNIIFQCANSWGDDLEENYLTGKGYFQMTARWLIQNLTHVTIHKNLLKKDEISAYNTCVSSEIEYGLI